MPEPSTREATRSREKINYGETTYAQYKDIQKRVDNIERELDRVNIRLDRVERKMEKLDEKINSSNRRLPTANFSSTDIFITASIGVIYSILK